MAKEKSNGEAVVDATVLGNCGNCPNVVKNSDDTFFIGTLVVKGVSYGITLCESCLKKPYFAQDRIIKKILSTVNVLELM